jgi:FMN-dependent oxidoreductase (nitrilotriacetate monooxygenase family)
VVRLARSHVQHHREEPSVGSRRIVLGLGTWGVGHFQPALWKDPEIPADASVNVAFHREWAQEAERAKLDFLLLADSQYITAHSPNHELNRFEPFTLLSALAVLTSRIGLVVTASTSYNSPYNLARRFASLEQLAGGRSGWNVVASRDSGTARNFGRPDHYDHDTRYRRALEHVRVVQGLWDSYEAGAFPADVANDRFFDPTKLHALDHVGEFFSVAGPLAVDRSPQGQPVLFQAGGSPQGRDFAARVTEVAFAAVRSFEHSLEYAEDIRARARAHGRQEPVLFVPWLNPVIADTDADAIELARENFEQDTSIDYLVRQFGRNFDWHDFTRYDLDAPFPSTFDDRLGDLIPDTRAIVHEAAKNGWTLREAVVTTSGAGEFRPPVFTGSAETVAAEIERWFAAGALDGIKAVFRTPSSLRRFTRGVVPILQDRGLFRTEYEASTLRGHLGLAVPENRYTAARRPAPVPATRKG